MKLFRHGPSGHEHLGLATATGQHLDLSAFGEDLNEAFFASHGLARLQAWLQQQGSLPQLQPGFRFGPCVARPSKIICVGLNYKDHAEESNMAVPAEPILFFKSTTSLSGPNDPVMLPQGSEKTDWEVELAVVIGSTCRHTSQADALSHVAGYALHNDYSERAFQLERGGQWVKGKSCDAFAPLGPYLVTADELTDPHHLALWLKVNGEYKQQGNTSNFIFNVPFLISYISQFMTLLPGDVISTGTPAGVGLGFSPPQYLKAGDVVQLGADHLGSSQQTIIPFAL